MVAVTKCSVSIVSPSICHEVIHIKKQRHYFVNKGPSSQGYGFSCGHVWMWELYYKRKCWRVDAFELWCWRRLLRAPWTARRSNQSILKEISPRCSLERLMLKLKFQYFGHLMWRADSWKRPLRWERLGTGGEGDNRGWDGWMASLTQWTWVWASSGRWWRPGKPGVLQSMGPQRVGHGWVTERQPAVQDIGRGSIAKANRTEKGTPPTGPNGNWL